MDWYKKARGVEKFAPAEDPGVMSVTAIFNYFKKYGYETIGKTCLLFAPAIIDSRGLSLIPHV
jgi:transaldolase